MYEVFEERVSGRCDAGLVHVVAAYHQEGIQGSGGAYIRHLSGSSKI